MKDNILGVLLILGGVAFLLETLKDRKEGNYVAKHNNTKGILASIIFIALGIFYLIGAM